MWFSIADQCHRKTDFPNCIDAIDEKHIRCINARKSGSNYFNYKHFFSVVLMAVVDASMNFIGIDMSAYGSARDSTVIRDIPLGRKHYLGQLNLPQ